MMVAALPPPPPAGPEVVDLTIIDLPGLVQSMGKEVSSEEEARYKALVQAGGVHGAAAGHHRGGDHLQG